MNNTMFFQLSTGFLVQHNAQMIFSLKKPLLFSTLEPLDSFCSSGLQFGSEFLNQIFSIFILGASERARLK